MRDLYRKGFNSNNPQSNYIKLQEQIECLQLRLRSVDQQLIDGLARITSLEERKSDF